MAVLQLDANEPYLDTPARNDSSALFPAAPVYARPAKRRTSSNLALVVGLPVVAIAAGALAWGLMAQRAETPTTGTPPAKIAEAAPPALPETALSKSAPQPPPAPATEAAPKPTQVARAEPAPAPRPVPARRAAPARHAAAASAPAAESAASNASATVAAPAAAPAPTPVIAAPSAPVPAPTPAPVTPVQPM